MLRGLNRYSRSACSRALSCPEGSPSRYPIASKRVKLSPYSTAQRSEIHLGPFDSRDSLPDAGDPAKEEKRDEGPGRSRQAGEEAREVEREEGPRDRKGPRPGGENWGSRRLRFSVEYCSFSACKRTPGTHEEHLPCKKS